LGNQKISDLNSHTYLTDLLDYESEVLNQFMNLGLPHTHTHKVKFKALGWFNIEVGNLKYKLMNLANSKSRIKTL
jgi:hypothetical protein